MRVVLDLEDAEVDALRRAATSYYARMIERSADPVVTNQPTEVVREAGRTMWGKVVQATKE